MFGKANSLKSTNVKMLVVAVGTGVSLEVLQDLATDNSYVFQVDDFDGFSSILEGLISSICTPGMRLFSYLNIILIAYYYF